MILSKALKSAALSIGEKTRGLKRRNLFRYRRRNKLVDAGSILRLRRTTASFSDLGSRKAYVRVSFIESFLSRLLGAELRFRIVRERPKSRRLNVTRIFASPFTAASKTISSLGSRNWGLQRKCVSTGSAIAITASRKIPTCRSDSQRRAGAQLCDRLLHIPVREGRSLTRSPYPVAQPENRRRCA